MRALKLGAIAVVLAIVVALFALLIPNTLNSPDEDAPTVADAAHASRAVISPNPKSSWRAHHSGMCCALPRAGGGYRVWLTGRETADGPFVIGWLDVDQDFNVVDEAKEPCLRPDPRDTKGVLMPCVVDVGDHHRMYFTGHLPGLAFSRDGGKTWEKHPERILKTDSVDTVSLGTNCVVRDGETWRTFYTAVQPRGPGKDFRDDRSFIRFAESSDGIHWTKPPNNLAIDAEPEGTSARPSVWKEGERWLMLFSTAAKMTRDFPGRQYRIHVADSDDGKVFHDRGQVLGPSRSPGTFDSERVSYPWSLPDDRGRYLYSGDDFGRTGIGLARLTIPRRRKGAP
ncbi:MAG: hypothetical protein AB7O26_18020 [Planctomycetaceae bacterium]